MPDYDDFHQMFDDERTKHNIRRYSTKLDYVAQLLSSGGHFTASSQGSRVISQNIVLQMQRDRIPEKEWENKVPEYIQQAVAKAGKKR